MSMTKVVDDRIKEGRKVLTVRRGLESGRTSSCVSVQCDLLLGQLCTIDNMVHTCPRNTTDNA